MARRNPSYKGNAERMERFITENGFRFHRYANDEKRALFCLLLDGAHEDFVEQRINVYVYGTAILFEAILPVSYGNTEKMSLLVNRMNIAQPVGSIQYDVRDGELTWNQFLPATRNWPGDGSIRAVLDQCQAMMREIYQSLLVLAAGNQEAEA